MKKSVLLPFMMVALLAIGTAATSYAQAKPGTPPTTEGTMSQPSGPSKEFSGPMRHVRPLEAMMKKLGITDEQKKQIRGLYAGFSDRTRKTVWI